MPALAYVLLPLSGTIAFLLGGSRRMRFPGLQSIALGAVWAVAAYAASWISPRLTQGVFVVGSLVWLGVIVGTLLGRDPRIPGSAILERAAAREDSEGDAAGSAGAQRES